MKRNSAPVANLMKGSLTKLSNALHPGNSATYQAGFDDSTYQAAPATKDLSLDAQTANALSAWAAKVVKGEIKIPSGLEQSEQLARDIEVLASARVSASNNPPTIIPHLQRDIVEANLPVLRACYRQKYGLN